MTTDYKKELVEALEEALKVVKHHFIEEYQKEDSRITSKKNMQLLMLQILKDLRQIQL